MYVYIYVCMNVIFILIVTAKFPFKGYRSFFFKAHEGKFLNFSFIEI